jgi:hypothetical protein
MGSRRRNSLAADHRAILRSLKRESYGRSYPFNERVESQSANANSYSIIVRSVSGLDDGLFLFGLFFDDPVAPRPLALKLVCNCPIYWTCPRLFPVAYLKWLYPRSTMLAWDVDQDDLLK